MGDTLKEGLLLKEEPGEAKWKKRWIVFRVGKDTAALYYYKVDDYINQSVPLGSFKVNSCSLYEYPAKSFAFELVLPPVISTGSGVVHPASHFRFQATNIEEQQSWMNTLRPYTTPAEEMQIFRTSPKDADGPPIPDDLVHSLDQMAPPSRRKTRDFGDDEAVLIELFPDVQVDVILDALDFCDGNRNAAIQLLAKQNRLNTPTDELDSVDEEDIEEGEDGSDEVWNEDGFTNKQSKYDRTEEDMSETQRQRGSWATPPRKDPVRVPIQRSASWHRVEPSPLGPKIGVKTIELSRPSRLAQSCDSVPLITNQVSTIVQSDTRTTQTDGGVCIKNDIATLGERGIVIRIVGAVRNGSYMEYILEVITQEARWLVYRRYSNFHSLHERLRKLGTITSKHSLPPKGIKGDNRDGLVRKRTISLGKYLDALIASDMDLFLENPIGKSFLDPKIPSVFYNKHLKAC